MEKFLSFDQKITEVLRLINQKKYLDAEINIKNLINLDDKNYIFFNIFGIILSLQNKNKEAISQFEKAIELNSNFPDAHYNIGTIFLKNKSYLDALKHLQQAIIVNKDYYNAFFNIADCYRLLGRYEEAIYNYNKCLGYNSEDQEVYNNLGLVYFEIKQFDLAKKNFQTCLDIDPSSYTAHNNIGLVYYNINKFEDSVLCFNKAISIKLDFVEAYNNLGLAFNKLNKNSLAVSYFEKSIELDPNFIDGYYNLAQTLKDSGKYSEAIFVLKNNTNISKNFKLKRLLADYLCLIGKIDEGIKYYEDLLDFEEKNFDDLVIFYKNYIFNLNYFTNFDQKKYFYIINLYKSLIKKHDDKNISKISSHIKNKKIKVGFVSGDFRDHAVAHQSFGILNELRKKSEFELYAYYNNFKDDNFTLKFKKIFNSWNNIFLKNDLEVSNDIQKDNIDILIDLSGYTEHNRLEIFKKKPAPVQVSWLGYLNSTGLHEIDYIIADNFTLPLNEDSKFKEKIYRLKDVWTNLTPLNDDIGTKSDPVLNNGYITFGSFNNISKINLNVINVWSKIINSIPNSKMLIKSEKFDDEIIKKNFLDLFLKFNNVKPSQLILEGYSKTRKEMLLRYNDVDIVLDTFPYPGHTTSLEASWMCVPIITMMGNSFISRCGESINANLDMKEWICANEDDYIKKAIFFAKDIDRLNLTRSKLKNFSRQSVLFNNSLFANNFSNALKSIWSLYLSKN